MKAMDIIQTIDDMRVNDTARAMMRDGFRLRADAYEALGDDKHDWVRSRLKLKVEYVDGYYVGTAR